MADATLTARLGGRAAVARWVVGALVAAAIGAFWAVWVAHVTITETWGPLGPGGLALVGLLPFGAVLGGGQVAVLAARTATDARAARVATAAVGALVLLPSVLLLVVAADSPTVSPWLRITLAAIVGAVAATVLPDHRGPSERRRRAAGWATGAAAVAALAAVVVAPRPMFNDELAGAAAAELRGPTARAVGWSGEVDEFGRGTFTSGTDPHDTVAAALAATAVAHGRAAGDVDVGVDDDGRTVMGYDEPPPARRRGGNDLAWGPRAVAYVEGLGGDTWRIRVDPGGIALPD